MSDKQKENTETDTMGVALVDCYDRLIASGRLPINVLCEYSSVIHYDRHFIYCRIVDNVVYFMETKPAYLISEF